MRTLTTLLLLLLAVLAAPSLAYAQDGTYHEDPDDSPLAFRPAPQQATDGLSGVSGETKWRSPAMAITGGALTLAGTANAVIGGVLYATDDCRDGGSWGCMFDMTSAMGVASMIHGGLMIAVGVPLFLVGSQDVPAGAEQAPPSRTAELRVGPSRADVVMTW